MERVCFQVRVRAERIDEYRERHQAVWPEMLAALSSTGWTNYSLFLREDGLLVGYFEAESFERSTTAMEERDVNTRWQADMAQYFADGQFERLEEVFHLA